VGLTLIHFFTTIITLIKWNLSSARVQLGTQAKFILNAPSNERPRFSFKPQIRLLPHKCIKTDHEMLF